MLNGELINGVELGEHVILKVTTRLRPLLSMKRRNHSRAMPRMIRSRFRPVEIDIGASSLAFRISRKSHVGARTCRCVLSCVIHRAGIGSGTARGNFPKVNVFAARSAPYSRQPILSRRTRRTLCIRLRINSERESSRFHEELSLVDSRSLKTKFLFSIDVYLISVSQYCSAGILSPVERKIKVVPGITG